METVKSGTAIIAEPKRTAQKGEPMSDLISRQDVLDEILRFSDNLDKDMLIRTYIRLNRLPSVQPVLTCKGCKYDYYEYAGCRNCLRKERDLYEPE